MSFSSDAKAELCRVPLTRRCCARAEAYGVLLYAGSFSPTEVPGILFLGQQAMFVLKQSWSKAKKLLQLETILCLL